MQIQRSLTGLLVVLMMAGQAQAEERPGQPPGKVVPAIVLFSQPYCPGCEAAKHHFTEQQIPYREFDISESDAARETFERLGGRGTPFLLIEGKRMQGFSIPMFEHYATMPERSGK